MDNIEGYQPVLYVPTKKRCWFRRGDWISKQTILNLVKRRNEQDLHYSWNEGRRRQG